MIVTEKTNFKISLVTLIVVLVFICSTVWAGAVYTTKLETKVDINCAKVEALERIVGTQVVQYAEIQTELQWVKASLIRLENYVLSDR